MAADGDRVCVTRGAEGRPGTGRWAVGSFIAGRARALYAPSMPVSAIAASAPQLADEKTHVVLAYVAALESNGYQVTPDELEVYATSPRRLLRTGTVALKFASVLDAFWTHGGPGDDETWVDYLARLRWIAVVGERDRRVFMTGAGRALLGYLNSAAAGLEELTPLVVHSGDPLAYATLIGQIAAQKDVLLVDAYIESRDLLVLCAEASVRRVLTSSKGKKGRLAELAATLSAIADERRPAVRVSGDIHDRFAVAADSVLSYGASLNGVGRHFTVVTRFVGGVAAALRSDIESRWKSAENLEPVASPPPQTQSGPSGISGRAAKNGRSRRATRPS